MENSPDLKMCAFGTSGFVSGLRRGGWVWASHSLVGVGWASGVSTHLDILLGQCLSQVGAYTVLELVGCRRH